MHRKCTVALASFLGLIFGGHALGQGSREVPVERDLERMERIDRRLDRNGLSPAGPNVSPDNPDGVVGFDGPPGIPGDNVDTGGPLPPGSPANANDE